MNRSMHFSLLSIFQGAAKRRGLIFGAIILCALAGFEVFNYSSTSFALRDVLGDLSFGPLRWATILAIAFCGIDFAGIARIFTPETGRDEPAEVWYLFAAWFLAATFNAVLTWWGVSVAMLKHNAEGGVLLGPTAMMKFVPVFVAAMVLFIRVLLPNTISIAGDRLFTLAEAGSSQYAHRPAYRPVNESIRNPASSFPRPSPKPTTAASSRPLYNEPTYQPLGMSAEARNENPNLRR